MDESTLSIDGMSPTKKLCLGGLSTLGGSSNSVVEHLLYNFKDLNQEFKSWVLANLEEKLRENPDKYLKAIKLQAKALEKQALNLYNNNQEK